MPTLSSVFICVHLRTSADTFSDIFCHAIGHENFVAFGIGVAFDFHVGDAGAFDGGFDDVFVKCADNFAGEIFRDGQPEAFFDFFGLDGDGFAQGREAADKVDVRFVVAVAVPVSEADQFFKFCTHAGFFEDFALDAVGNVFARVQRTSGQFVVGSCGASVQFADDQEFFALVDDDSARADVMRGVFGYEGIGDELFGEQKIVCSRVVKCKSRLCCHGDERGPFNGDVDPDELECLAFPLRGEMRKGACEILRDQMAVLLDRVQCPESDLAWLRVFA